MINPFPMFNPEYIGYVWIPLLALLSAATLVYIAFLKRCLSKQIITSIEPKFIDLAISPSSSKVIWLAIDTWRLEERMEGVVGEEGQMEKVRGSMERIKKFTAEHFIEVKGYRWEKYSQDITFFELKWITETNEESLHDIIKDTIEPAVFYEGRLVSPAKVIVYQTPRSN
jgi:hypothetical protein